MCDVVVSEVIEYGCSARCDGEPNSIGGNVRTPMPDDNTRGATGNVALEHAANVACGEDTIGLVEHHDGSPPGRVDEYQTQSGRESRIRAESLYAEL